MDSSASKTAGGDGTDVRKRDSLTSAKELFDKNADTILSLLAKPRKSKTDEKEANEGESNRKTIAELELKIKDLKAEVYDAKELLAESKKEGSGTCTKCATNAAEQKSSLATIEDLKRKMKIMKAHHAKVLQEEKDAHAETEQRRIDIDTSRGTIMVEHSDITMNLQALQAKHDQLSNEHTELKRQHNSTFSISPEQFNQLSAQKEALQSELHTAQTSLEQALEAKSAIMVAFEKANLMSIKIMEATASDKAVKAKLNEKVIQLSENESKLSSALQTEREARQREKSVQLEEMKTLKIQLMEMSEEKSRLQAELEKERIEIKKYKTALNKGAALAKFGSSSGSVHSASGSTGIDHNHTISSTGSEAGAMVSPQRFQVTFNNPHNTNTSAPFSPQSNLPRGNSGADHNDEFSVLSDTTHPRHSTDSNINSDYLYVPYIPDPTNPIDAINHFNGNIGLHSATPNITTHNYPPDVYNTDIDKPAKHVKRVFVLHHAPQRHRMSPLDIQRELSRYGPLASFHHYKDTQAYYADYDGPGHANNALNNLPLHLNGFEISCEKHYNQLRTAPVIEWREDNNGAQKVVLRDPVLKGNRSKLHCSICEEEGRFKLVDTHHTDNCFYRYKSPVNGSGPSRNKNPSSNGSASLSVGRERKRGRSESPERPSRKVTTSSRTSTGSSSRDVSADGRGGDGANFRKSRDEEGDDGYFDPLTGVRPLNTAR